jgi:hypothetical protein
VIRTLKSAEGANPGFDARNVVLMAVDLRPGGYGDMRGSVFYESLLTAVRAEPGVEAATLASRLPLRAVEGRRRQVSVERYELKTGDELRFSVDTITSDYFRSNAAG